MNLYIEMAVNKMRKAEQVMKEICDILAKGDI